MFQKYEDMSSAPFPPDVDTKKNASPEVEVINPEVETIEISPESTQNEQKAPSCESLDDLLLGSKSRLILSVSLAVCGNPSFLFSLFISVPNSMVIMLLAGSARSY